MALSPANAEFLNAQTRRWAASGIDHLQEVPLLPGMEIWRFASSDQSAKWIANPWWVGKSGYQALCRLTDADKTSLASTARACLAVVSDPRAVERPNRMDVLSHALTQLFIPGLEIIWKDVLRAAISRPL